MVSILQTCTYLRRNDNWFSPCIPTYKYGIKTDIQTRFYFNFSLLYEELKCYTFLQNTIFKVEPGAVTPAQAGKLKTFKILSCVQTKHQNTATSASSLQLHNWTIIFDGFARSKVLHFFLLTTNRKSDHMEEHTAPSTSLYTVQQYRSTYINT